MRYFLNVLLSITILSPLIFDNAAAQENSASADSYRHIPDEEITAGDKAINFSIVYGVQWAAYFATQESIIRKHGTMKNYRENIFKPHFDKDHLNYNLSKHTVTGQYYYLFYRSRGYGKQSSFYWAFISSAAFEFTIENLTERPSYQDLYQTPVFGSILGMGAERLSLYLHSLQTLPTTLLGYLLNPTTIVPYPYSRYHLAWTPMRMDDKTGIALQLGVAL